MSFITPSAHLLEGDRSGLRYVCENLCTNLGPALNCDMAPLLPLEMVRIPVLGSGKSTKGQKNPSPEEPTNEGPVYHERQGYLCLCCGLNKQRTTDFYLLHFQFITAELVCLGSNLLYITVLQALFYRTGRLFLCHPKGMPVGIKIS